MNLKDIYTEILNEHNRKPSHMGTIEKPDFILQGINPTCGDDYTLQFIMDGDTIKDGKFVGDGCAISKASTDMMLDLMIGKSKGEAIHFAEIFQNMIRGNASQEEIEELEDAGILESVSHMPARVKCAVLPWRTAEEIFNR